MKMIIAWLTGFKPESFKSLGLYTIWAVVISVITFVFMNNERIMNIWENSNKEKIRQELKLEEIKQYKHTSKERTAITYMQSNADIVGVFEYTPQYINDFSNLQVHESKLLLEKQDWQNIVVNKASPGYQAHLAGRPYSYMVDDAIPPKFGNRNPITSVMSKYDIHHGYSCPIFNLQNHYAGYVAMGWVVKPFTNEQERAELETELYETCTQSARAIGRTK